MIRASIIVATGAVGFAYEVGDKVVVIHDKEMEYDKAIADCDEALRLEPMHVLAFIVRATGWGLKAEFDKELADLNDAIQLDQVNVRAFVRAYRNRGIAWGSQGDTPRPSRITRRLFDSIRRMPRSTTIVVWRGHHQIT